MHTITHIVSTFCSIISHGVCSIFDSPLELFKCKLQAQRPGVGVQYANVFQCAYAIAKQYGIRGVYQGYSTVLLREGPSTGVYFGVYEGVRHFLRGERGSVRDLSPSALLAAGGAAGFVFWGFNCTCTCVYVCVCANVYLIACVMSYCMCVWS